MIRFFSGLAIGIYFFTKVDILIWQRIFEANKLWDLETVSYTVTYHQGWTYSLFGFMALGVILFYPNFRRMIMFPLSLFILAFSGLEDILYYWLDGRTIPIMLPWLNSNPLILQPVSRMHLLLSAAIWLSIIVLMEIGGVYLDRKINRAKVVVLQRGETTLSRLLCKMGSLKEHIHEGMLISPNSFLYRAVSMFVEWMYDQRHRMDHEEG